MYIYLDESGDLGFDFSKKGTSDFFVITLLVCHDAASKKTFQVAVKKTIKNKFYTRRKFQKIHRELKGVKSSLSAKKYFFSKLTSSEWNVYTVVLNKRRVYEKFWDRKGQNKIYNFLAKFIIEKLPLKDATNNVRLVVDKSKSRAEIVDFNNYISTYIEGALPLNTAFLVEHLGSHEDAGLQAVDLFCWGINRKYKDKDMGWYDVFKEKISFEEIYLPG